jgi:hypothetical protein
MASHHSLDPKEHLSQIRRRATNESSTHDTDMGTAQHPLLNLQRQVGNAQIARMIAQRNAEEEQEEGGAVQAMHDPSAVQRNAEEEQEEGGAVQAMHDPAALQRNAEEEQEEGGAVQAMHDPAALQRTPEEEQEEGGAVQAMHDPAALQRNAEEEQEEGGAVQAMHDPSALQRNAEEEQEEGGAVQAMHDPAALQRNAEEEQEEGGGMVQAKPEVGLEGGPISADLGGKIQSKRGSGSPLDDGMRASMEGAFNTSFEDVRIHTDGESQQLNRQISAKAFTTGNDIFFGDGASPADTKLLGHELTHVVQQRSMSTSGPMTVGPAGNHHEQEADDTGAAVASAIASGKTQQPATEDHETA